jgi:hypothetical protein
LLSYIIYGNALGADFGQEGQIKKANLREIVKFTNTSFESRQGGMVYFEMRGATSRVRPILLVGN